MRAPIVFGDDLDVLVTVPSVQHVLDPEVGEVDALIEGREVMIAGPFLDLARVAIRSAVAVGSAAIVLLQPLLVLAFELLLEHDTADVSALFAEPFLLAQECGIQLRVVRQLARPADAFVEGLLAVILTVATV